MTMEVLKKGGLSRNTARKFECKVCKAVVLAKRSEARFDCDNEHMVLVCPECFHHNYIANHRWHETPPHQVITL